MGFTLPLVILTLITAVFAFPTNQIYLQMPHSDLNCLSWWLAVETNNLQKWKQIPEPCLDYIRQYMLGEQYRNDCDFVTTEAYEYAKGLDLSGDGKDVWVFDIDETTLSNIPYYASDKYDFGAIPYNATVFNEWVEEAIAPAIPGSLKLYKNLIKLGFKIVFLTGTEEAYREARTKNLRKVGYTKWEKLIFKGVGDTSALVYKSKKRKELEDAGYRIRGNMGDQWSDLLGANPGDRTFKLPDPMYYVG